MNFSHRFTLAIILVLSICSTSYGAVASRHTRQTQLFEPPPESLSSEDVNPGDDTANIKQNSSVNATQEINSDSQNITINGSRILRKPKTENITNDYVDNNNNNSTDNKDRTNVINKDNLEKSNKSNENAEIIDTAHQKTTERNFENQDQSENSTKKSETTRNDKGRSLDLDIRKYISADFHNKNNEYSFSVSPDTDKYTNLQNVLSDYVHSNSEFDVQLTTDPYNFDERRHNIERGIKETLKYIDDKTSSKENHNFGQFSTDSVKDILNKHTNGDLDGTQSNLNYTRFKNITSDDSINKNHVHKELDLTSGQNLDFNSSFRKTEILNDLQKDYKNQIPTKEEDLNTKLLSAESIDRNVLSSTFITPTAVTKQSVITSSESVIPEILKTSLIQNETGTQKPTISNNIDLDIGSKQNKLKWKSTRPNILYPRSTVRPLRTTKPGQVEESIYVPYSDDATISVAKRGSTKYTDTVKATTESFSINKNAVSNKNKSILSNNILLTEKENSSSEQAVQENQNIPVQVVAPINLTSTTANQISESSTPTFKHYTILPNFLTTFKLNKSLLDLSNNLTTPMADSTESSLNSELTTVELSTLTITKDEFDMSTPNDFDQTTEFDKYTDSTIKSLDELEKLTVGTLTTNEDVIQDATASQTIASIIAESDLSSKDFDMSTTSIESTTQESLTGTTIMNTKYTGPDIWTYLSKSSSTDPADWDLIDKILAEHRSSSGRNMKTTAKVTTTDSTSTIVIEETSTTQNNLNTEVAETTEMSSTLNLVSTTDDAYFTTSKISSTNKVIYNKNITEQSHRHITDNFDKNSTHPHTSSSTQRQIISSNYDNTSESTPLIIPLNISIPELENGDTTTSDTIIGLEEDKAESNGGKIAAITISCIGAVCLIILAGLLFIMRKRHKRFNYGQRCTPVSLDAYSVDNVSVYNSVRRKAAIRASKRSYGNLAFDDASITSNPLNFSALVKFSSNKDAIAKEFEEVPQVTAQTSELPEGCETKNRYANVIPLPETRVFLSSTEGQPNSDYINANFVTGPKSSKRYYIACQAPIQSTVDDLWKMVWEQQSKVIIMLTHLFENGTEKCVDYLPPSEVLDCHRLFGDYHVTLKKREVKEKYVISSLHLKNMVSNSWREVTHLWYLGWPEKGVPSEANSLIAFLIEARSYNKSVPAVENGKSTETINGSINSEQNPVIVHCSPGTGRTGTVIACDIAIREFELTRQVDIPKTVYRIRRDRASSVQTKEQYGFIYEVITLYATKLTGGVLDSL